MADIRELVWQEAAPMLFISREQYFGHLEGWDIHPFEVDGEPVFAMLIKGPEFHLSTFHTGRRFPLKEFMDRLRVILDEHGHATTRTPLYDLGDTVEAGGPQHRLNRRFGFVEIGRDQYDVHYWLDRETFMRRHQRLEKEPCQQPPL